MSRYKIKLWCLLSLLLVCGGSFLYGDDSKEHAGGNKKMKAHFVGSKRPHPENSSDQPVIEAKKSSKVKNKWVSSKTYPKSKKKLPV